MKLRREKRSLREGRQEYKKRRLMKEKKRKAKHDRKDKENARQ